MSLLLLRASVIEPSHEASSHLTTVEMKAAEKRMNHWSQDHCSRDDENQTVIHGVQTRKNLALIRVPGGNRTRSSKEAKHRTPPPCEPKRTLPILPLQQRKLLLTNLQPIVSDSKAKSAGPLVG